MPKQEELKVQIILTVNEQCATEPLDKGHFVLPTHIKRVQSNLLLPERGIKPSTTCLTATYFNY